MKNKCCSNCGDNEAMYCTKCLHEEKAKNKELEEHLKDAVIVIDMLCSEHFIEGKVNPDSIFTARGVLKRIKGEE